MVAYSSTFCLPCLEGTDSPCTNTGTVCEPSTVWCDLVNAVEDFLLPISGLVSRTATTVPLASITGNEVVFPSSPVTIVFNTVEYDTDNMVNLDADPTVITPQRDGMYLVYGRVITPTEPVPLDGFIHTLTITSGTDSVVAEYPEVSVATGSFLITAQKLFRWQNGVSSPFQMRYQGLQPSVQTARMTAWWVSDL